MQLSIYTFLQILGFPKSRVMWTELTDIIELRDLFSKRNESQVFSNGRKMINLNNWWGRPGPLSPLERSKRPKKIWWGLWGRSQGTWRSGGMNYTSVGSTARAPAEHMIGFTRNKIRKSFSVRYSSFAVFKQGHLNITSSIWFTLKTD